MQPGEGWDVLRVDGKLDFAATQDMPWVLQIGGLPTFIPNDSEPWLIASANQISGFDASAVRFDLSGILSSAMIYSPDNFSLFERNGGLYLQAASLAIPELASCWLIFFGALASTGRR